MPSTHPCNHQRLVLRFTIEDLTFLNIKEPFLRLTETPLHPALGSMSQMSKVGALLALNQIRETAAMLMSLIPGADEHFQPRRTVQGGLMIPDRPSHFAVATVVDPLLVRNFRPLRMNDGLSQEQSGNSEVTTSMILGNISSVVSEPLGGASPKDHDAGNQMGLTSEIIHGGLTESLVGQPFLIDELPKNVKKSQSKRRRLMYAPRTTRAPQPSPAATVSSRAPKSTTFSVNITANRANFTQRWKRSISETKFGGRGAAKKQRINTTDQKKKELANLLADNVTDKSTNVGRLLAGIKQDLVQTPSKAPLWSLSQRNTALGYITKTVDVRKLELLIPKEVPAEDFKVVFPCHDDLLHVCKHRSNSDFVKMGSVVLRLADKLLQYAKNNRIDIKNAPGATTPYTATALVQECEDDPLATGMNFVDFARYSEFILKMAFLLRSGSVPFLSNNLDNPKIRQHVTNLIDRFNGFLTNWDKYKCPFKLLREIRTLASLRKYDYNDLFFTGEPPQTEKLLESSVGQFGVLSLEDQCTTVRKLARKVNQNGSQSSFVIRGGSVLQFLQCTSVPNLTSDEKTWSHSNPLWIKLCGLLGQKLLKVDECKIGGGEVAIIKNGQSGNEYLDPPQLRIPGVATGIRLEDVGNETSSVSDLMVVAASVNDISYESALSNGRNLRFTVLDSSAWVKDPRNLFTPCRHFFGKMSAKAKKDVANETSEESSSKLVGCIRT